MTSLLKHYVSSKMSHLLKDKHRKFLDQTNINMLPSSLSPFTLHLRTTDTDFLDDIEQAKSKFSDENVENVTIHHSPRYRGVSFKINQKYFIDTLLNDLKITNFEPVIKSNPKMIVIDYSSPNIAKPFHMGHLRSTIIGNFIANISEHYGDHVKRINYLGDWGTQFGLLKVGVESLQYSKEQIKEAPIERLYNAYVHANKLAEDDPNISEMAKDTFKQLENGSKEGLNDWELYRKYTIDELKAIYDRLGVEFDEYHWESMYGADVSHTLVNSLVDKKIVEVCEDGHKTIRINDRDVTLQRSNGTSLYLTRDIAAVLDRYRRYSFDKMLYVVDNSQTDHFASLFEILNKMDAPCKDKCEHIKFGKINGLSTRKGNTVFLRDILDEARERMYVQQKESPNTLVDIEDTSITDALGITAVVINDLNQKRTKNYDFAWDKVLHMKSVSGIKLQYLHCRLWRLETYAEVELPTVCKAEFLQEPEALNVIHRMAKFDFYLDLSKEKMEAFILLNYLFPFADAVNAAFKALQVKDTETELAQQRLLLFHCARKIVKRSLEILGVKPFNQM